MQALLGEWELTTNLFRLLFPQVLVFTVLVRLLGVGLHRWLGGRWRMPLYGIVLAHAVALAAIAVSSDFIDPGLVEEQSLVATFFHSVSVLWLMQVIVLVPDLAFHAFRRWRSTH